MNRFRDKLSSILFKLAFKIHSNPTYVPLKPPAIDITDDGNDIWNDTEPKAIRKGYER